MHKVVLAALLVACAVLVVAPAGPAAKGGNSKNAKLCQKGGYKDWVRADQTPFKNVGKCVSYAARGGTLTAPTPAQDHAFCAPLGPLAFGQCSVPGRMDFDFDASSGPLGQNPTGTFLVETLPRRVEGTVTCLQVTGNRAAVGGEITASTHPELVGMGFAFTVLDGGASAPDLMGLLPVGQGTLLPLVLPTPPAANTPNCGSVIEPSEPVTGDIVAEDN
jgi:hypothetical protein